jgi:hypothetical protein
MQPRQTLSPIPDEQMPTQGVAGWSAGGMVMMAALYKANSPPANSPPPLSGT